MLVQCPEGCREYVNNGKTKKVFGGSPEGQGVYTANSQFCVAALHQTGFDGGIFRITYVPEAKFSYDLSPMAVAVRTTGKRWYDFVTSICAIVGGTFTTVGLVDAVAHKVLKAGKQL